MEIGLVEESAIFLDGFSRWPVILDGYPRVAGRRWPLLDCAGGRHRLKRCGKERTRMAGGGQRQVTTTVRSARSSTRTSSLPRGIPFALCTLSNPYLLPSLHSQIQSCQKRPTQSGFFFRIFQSRKSTQEVTCLQAAVSFTICFSEDQACCTLGPFSVLSYSQGHMLPRHHRMRWCF